MIEKQLYRRLNEIQVNSWRVYMGLIKTKQNPPSGYFLLQRWECKGRSVVKSTLLYGPLQRWDTGLFHTWWNHPLRCWDVFCLSLMTKRRRGNWRTSDQPDSDPQNCLIPQMYWTPTVCQALGQTLRLPYGQNAQKRVPSWLSRWRRQIIDKISDFKSLSLLRRKLSGKRGYELSGLRTLRY